MPVAKSPRMTLESASVRIRKMRNGMIGFFNLDSKRKNETSRTTAAPPHARVGTEAHPEAVAWMMA
jgi:hypothetical protein